MKKYEENEKVIKITHLGELLIWLLIIFSFVALFSITHINHKKNATNDYQIFIPDADGLIVGSPVRMMGIHVGHVVQIKPMKDEVYVKFVLTNPDVYIPHGSEIVVEFSGLAASKSLELYLPEDKDLASEYPQAITVLPTKRLNDSLGLLNTMYKKFMSIIYTTSSFHNSIGEIIPKVEKSVDLSEFLQYSNKILDDSIQRSENFGKNIERLQKNDK